MTRVSQWNERCNNKAPELNDPERKVILLNQLARLQEELDETIKAVKEEDEVETLDGIADLMVVLEGVCYLSRLDTKAAFELVMDNNNLKYERDFSTAFNALLDSSHCLHCSETSDGKFYSIHRISDNKICKLPNHPRVDLSGLVGDSYEK